MTDWHDYDTHYTERYLGLPKDLKAYDVRSLLLNAKDSKRPLLLIHGTADDNVYFLHSLKLSDALFMAGKRPRACCRSAASRTWWPTPPRPPRSTGGSRATSRRT